MESKKLNPLIWDVRNNLYDPIKKKLLSISQDFLDTIEAPVEIKNIFLTGSLCTYEWTDESDWDLHIIVSIEKEYCNELTIKDYFDAKSKLYNKEHNIYIKGYPVEVNLKEKEELLKDKAVYDLQKGKWLVTPVHSEITLNNSEVLKKTKEMQSIIRDAIENEVSLEELKEIRDEIKSLRKVGLETDGEFSIGNLVFKNLRHSGYIKNLYDYKAKLVDADLSLESFSGYFKKILI
jgi:predicted nucleotidyltransferase